MRFLMLLAGGIAILPPIWAQGTDSADPLDHTKWKLAGSSSRAATLVFDEGSFMLSACNSTGGKYSVSGDRIVIAGPLRSTKRACLETSEDVDAALARVLTENTSFKIAGDKLTLSGPKNARYTFMRAPLPSKTAVTKFIYVGPTQVDCPDGTSGKCLQLRENKNDAWQTSSAKIVGFTPVPGIQYRLRVKEDMVAGGAGGTPEKVWYLDMVVEQSVIDREAADAYHKDHQGKK